MIVDHVWRPTHFSGTTADSEKTRAQCAYMNCRRPRSEHERGVNGAMARER